MPRKAKDAKPRAIDSEKITINLGLVDLGQIDLLVEEGFYSNRTDLIRTAIRAQIARHDETLKKTVERRSIDLGLRRFTRHDLEALVTAGERLNAEVLGLAIIDPDVTAELAASAIGSLRVLGALQASPAVKAALKDRMA
ncbi:CopG family transcriptional regulator [Fulvimarina sp. 2208YS6-2-32]|uniref:CopG family transcriptional regulator n=1 Tax=Fulvimarina uroteuthidis TaxID=3098149 RepID=A0ABU5HXF2_9HYPH|nr:CopG family transcriptional regulator [Fulvimarina sp. 2208YS6-2-32]MDY8107720.1 CopG family transcriptional regulator [Fulvimarina sp. 2208YS6-2-32]